MSEWIDEQEKDYFTGEMRKNYIKGLLWDITPQPDSVDLDLVTEKMIKQAKLVLAEDVHGVAQTIVEARLQKVVLGDIADFCTGATDRHSEVVAVSVKIANFLYQQLHNP